MRVGDNFRFIGLEEGIAVIDRNPCNTSFKVDFIHRLHGKTVKLIYGSVFSTKDLGCTSNWDISDFHIQSLMIPVHSGIFEESDDFVL